MEQLIRKLFNKLELAVETRNESVLKCLWAKGVKSAWSLYCKKWYISKAVHYIWGSRGVPTKGIHNK